MATRPRRKSRAIPAPAAIQDPAVAQILWAIKERLDLLGPISSEEFAALSSTLSRVSNSQPIDAELNPIRPTEITGLVATGLFGSILLDWDTPNPETTAFVEVHAADVDDLGQAVLIGTSIAPLFLHFVGDSAVGRYYWIRGVGHGSAALKGPFNSPSGTFAQPALLDGDFIEPFTVDATQIADAAIITQKLADATVSNAKLANLAVDAAKLASSSVSNTKIADFAVSNQKIANFSVTAAKIGSAAITSAKIANLAVGSAAIANLAVGTTKIADAAIVEAKIGNLEVSTAKLQDLSVSTAKIANAAVTAAQILDATIGTAKILDAAINTAKIADAAIVEAKIANAAITNAKIGTAAITSAKIGDAEVGTLKIAGHAVTLPLLTVRSTTLSLSDATFHILNSITVTPQSSDVALTVTALTVATTEFQYVTRIRVTRPGVTLFHQVVQDNYDETQPTLDSYSFEVYDFSAPVGVSTEYLFQLQIDTVGGNASTQTREVRYSSLGYLELRR